MAAIEPERVLQLVQPLGSSYVSDETAKAQVVVGASFGHIELVNGGTLKPSIPLAADGSKGGIVYVRANKITVRSGGEVTAAGMGYQPTHGAQSPIASPFAGAGQFSATGCGGSGGGSNQGAGEDGQGDGGCSGPGAAGEVQTGAAGLQGDQEDRRAALTEGLDDVTASSGGAVEVVAVQSGGVEARGQRLEARRVGRHAHQRAW